MSYTLPSVRIYQLLENSGGAVRSTPDLDTVLIGPLYNIVEKEAARSLSFSKWPTAAVDPLTPPESVYTLDVGYSTYYDYGMPNDVGITFYGHSSDAVGTDFELILTAPDLWGEWGYGVLAYSTITRDPATGQWTAVITDASSAELYLNPATPELECILTGNYTLNDQNIVAIGRFMIRLPTLVRPS